MLAFKKVLYQYSILIRSSVGLRTVCAFSSDLDPIMPLQTQALRKPFNCFKCVFYACVIVLIGCDRGSESTSTGQPGNAATELAEDLTPPLSEVPGDPRLKVGKELLMAGRLDESLIIFETVLRDRPELARAHFLKGMTLHGRKSHALALQHYLKSEALNQDFAEHELLDYYVAWSAFYAGEAELAQDRVERCLLDNPERADPNFLAGLLAFNDDRLEDAEVSLRLALQYGRLEPEPARSRELRRAWIRLSDVLARAERREEALEAVTNAIEIQPDFAESWFRKASLLSRLGRESEAQEALVRWQALGGGPG